MRHQLLQLPSPYKKCLLFLPLEEVKTCLHDAGGVGEPLVALHQLLDQAVALLLRVAHAVIQQLPLLILQLLELRYFRLLF